ncbi:MAG: hypothetical protein ACK5TH_10595 [Prosthecobacter sp.]|jgi:hypothetical protein
MIGLVVFRLAGHIQHMTITARVQNRTIHLPADVPIADGTLVTIHTEEVVQPKKAAGSWMLKYAGMADDLPTDAASQHDHYLYGAPKR